MTSSSATTPFWSFAVFSVPVKLIPVRAAPKTKPSAVVGGTGHDSAIPTRASSSTA